MSLLNNKNDTDTTEAVPNENGSDTVVVEINPATEQNLSGSSNGNSTAGFDKSFNKGTGTDDQPAGLSPASILDVFKREQQEIASAKTVFIAIPGYEESGLKALYRMPTSGRELDAIGRKAQSEFNNDYDRNLYTAIDSLIALCEGLYVQPTGVEAPVMFDPENTGAAAQYDQYLAEILGVEKDSPEFTARGVVYRLFGGREKELAILSHCEKLSRWLGNAKADVESELWQRGQ